jgi:hypothetical protein
VFAPEILQQLKDKVLMSKLVFMKKCYVYSYDMTCYELSSGCLPFEDYEDQLGEGYNLLLEGHRLE